MLLIGMAAQMSAQQPSAQPSAPEFSSRIVGGMQWRMIGPFRGGRTRAVSGVPSEPNVFYIGAVNGGVWKTNDYGRTWNPIFDSEPTGSIGAIAVAPSDPNTIYVGSGEGLHRPDLSVGDGIYKSTDAGKTWTHLGLREGQQIPQLAVDPHDPNRVFAAVLGHPYGPNPERGIYRSTDGGKTFEKVLYKDENTGGSDVQIDPTDPNIIYACMWEAREGPWENGEWQGTNGGIFKSTDGGTTWQKLTKGLPDGVVQADVAIAPSDSNRVYATVATNHDQGIYVSWYRSDDGGANWYKVTNDNRPATRIGGGDLPVPKVDPKNPDIVYSTSISTWRSKDGGKTWTAIRGAPGGDDYQNIWINPNNPEIILLASDQGAIVTVNGGQTWSSWYNQPTAQLYHVSADNAFPYRVCSGQQESGSVCIRTRGNDGEITIRDWHPVGAEEYGYAAPDPLDPDIVFGGKLSRYDRRTGQTADVSPEPMRSGDYRVLRTEPIVFSPTDPHVLYFASNTLWETRDGGKTWKQISPDLTRKTWQVPTSVGIYTSEVKPTQRGVIYAVAPSPLDGKRIWVGTDDGLIQLTTDGGLHWQNVTPPELKPFQKVSIIEASHFDPQTAYAAINTLRLDDLHPHILRTRDGGKTWTEIVNGIPDNNDVNAVREDPKRKGLLFAATERMTFVSFDDGDHWQSLRLNMPATSVRDLTIKDNDLIAATHGRGFWVLDDITPLRQWDDKLAASSAFLFKPETATRIRWDTNTDTPLPPDFPAGLNPPDGAVIDYYLQSNSAQPVTLEILDASGKVIRRYSSSDHRVAPSAASLAIPAYWVRPPQNLSAEAGIHRFLWNLHLAPVPNVKPEYPISAVPHNTAPQPTSPWVLPGQYTVRLTANGQTLTQPLVVKMDPRVKTSAAGLEQQFRLSKQMYEGLLETTSALLQAKSLRAQLDHLKNQGGAAPAVAEAEEALSAVAGGEEERRPRAGAKEKDTLSSVNGELKIMFDTLQSADVAPTAPQAAAAADAQRKVAPVMAAWNRFKGTELPQLNAKLRAAGLPELNPNAPVDDNEITLRSRNEE
jgi:photosystem II stability/assembly factor-like uncharacterized protein